MSTVDYSLLGIDAVALAIVYTLYRRRKHNFETIASAPVIELSKASFQQLAKSPGGVQIPYAVVQGTVKADGQPLRSSYDNNVVGVVKKSDVFEHRWRWSWAARWWVQERSSVSSSRNAVPFVLRNKFGDASVEVLETASVEDAVLTNTYDGFEPRQASIASTIFSFFSGQQLTGHEYVERMLTEGSPITAIGTLTALQEGGRLYLQLRPPLTNGESTPGPYLLSSSSIDTIIAELRRDVSTCSTVAYILTGLGVALLVHVAVKMRRARRMRLEKQLEVERLREMVEAARLRRTLSGSGPEPGMMDDGSGQCIICLVNPREVLILECGHLCCCLSCGQLLDPALCPVCRSPIVRLAPAYIP